MLGPEQLINQLYERNSNVVRLAETVSIATLIEPQLLRKVRLELLSPGVDAGAEADLWFSDLVQFRSPIGIGLRNDVAELLRQRLKSNKELLAKAWEITETLHKTKSTAISLEEKLIWLELSGQRDELQTLLRQTVSTLVSRDRQELPYWIARALPRFPETLRRLEEAQMLALGTSLRVELEEELLNEISRENVINWTGWLAPDIEEVTTYGVRLVEGGIEFGSPSMPKAHKIELPDNQPHIVEISWYNAGNEEEQKQVRLYSGKQQVIEVDTPEFELRTLSGTSYRISSRVRLDRVRAPRVHITYEVETGGGIQMKELPFVVGVLTDLSGTEDQLPSLKDRKFVEIDRDNFNSVLASLTPRLAYRVKNNLKDYDDKLGILLQFGSMDDFEPENVITQIEPLRILLNLRRLLFDLQAKANGNEKLTEKLQEIMNDSSLSQEMFVIIRSFEKAESGSNKTPIQVDDNLLDQLLSLGQKKKVQGQSDASENPIDDLVKKELKDEKKKHEDLDLMLNDRIDQLDKRLSSQLSKVLHAKEFQQLEAAWRGLHYLVHQSETNSMLKIKILNASKHELLKDQQEAKEFDQSALFKKVYEEEYGAFGGAPYGVLIGDFQFGRDPQDIALLQKISKVAAAAHAPFLSAVDSTMFNLDSYSSLPNTKDISSSFDSSEMAKWKSFRDSEESHYVGLTLPRILIRLPYGKETIPVEAFTFEEGIDDGDQKKLLFGNSVYALGSCITRSFATYHWCAAIRGVESGGLVEGLPTYKFKDDYDDIVHKCSTEIAIKERREYEISHLGFIPLEHNKGTDKATFFNVYSCHKAMVYENDVATANARLSTKLQYLFASSRFAQYLKVMTRDKIGSFMTKQNCEDFLNQWIANYVLVDDNTKEMKAKKPLREARIKVEDMVEQPGMYKAVLWIKPHFQLDEMSASMKIEVLLPGPGKG